MKLFSQGVLTCASTTGTSVSDALNIEFSFNIAAQVDLTGTATVKLQHSNDGVNWFDITSASVTADGMIITSSPARFLRAHCTAGAGTVSASVDVLGKR